MPLRLHYTPLFITLIIGLFFWPGSSYPSPTTKLRPGDVQTLLQDKEQSVELLIPKTGMYRLETLGNQDTKCQLHSLWKGPSKQDDNSGSAKNCRFDQRFTQGTYRLHVKKAKGSVKVRLIAYAEGSEVILSPGILAQETLKAMQYHTFRFVVRRHQKVKVKAFSNTLGRCMVFHQDGWRKTLRAQYQNLRATNLGYMKKCIIQGYFSPGNYSLRVYGKRSKSSSKGKSVLTSPLEVIYGARAFPLTKAQNIRLPQDGRLELEFNISDQLYQNKFFLFLYGSSRASRRYWRVNVNYLGPNTTTSKSLVPSTRTRRAKRHRYFTSSCSVSGRSRNKNCSIRLQPRPGFYQIKVYGSYGQGIRLGSYLFKQARTSLILGKRHPILTSPGQQGEAEITIKESGSYWVESWPRTKSCLLKGITGTRSGQIIAKRGLFLKNTPRIIRASMQGDGMSEWFHTSQSGTLRFESIGAYDTYCTLYDRNGNVMVRNDDGGVKRNCLISRQLAPGSYRIQVRPYSRTAKIVTQVKMSFGTSAAESLRSIENCQFPVYLEKGQYRLYTGQSGSFQLQNIAIFKQPLQEGQLLIIKRPKGKAVALKVQISKQISLSVQNAQDCTLTRQGRVIRGRNIGLTCRIDTATQYAGVYKLFFTQHIQSTEKMILRLGHKVRMGRYNPSESLLRAEETKPKAFVPEKAQALTFSQKSFFEIRTNQAKRFTWEISKAGLYHIQTHGLLKLHCLLQTPSVLGLTNSSQSRSGRNCEFTEYFPKGKYQVRIVTKGRSSGRAGIEIKALPQYKGKTAWISRRLYQKLPKRSTNMNPFQIDRKGEYQIQVYSPDNHMRCRIESQDGWPLLSGSQCQWSGKLNSGSYKMWVYTNKDSARYRTLFNRKSAFQQFWPKSQDFKPNKSHFLPLHGTHTATLSLKGRDTYSLILLSDTKLYIHLNNYMFGRLFNGSKFVAHFSDENPGTLTLSKGTYQLHVQDPKTRSSVNYEIDIQVTASGPGTSLWRKAPSSIEIIVKQRARIELETEGDKDVWCQLYSSSDALLQTSDNFSKRRWDCKISKILDPGIYKLRIEGASTSTWLHIRERKLEVRGVLTAKKTSFHLPRKGISGLTFELKAAKAVYFWARSKTERIACALEDLKNKKVIGRTGGRSCHLTRMLTPGFYRWRVRAIDKGQPRKVNEKSATFKAKYFFLPVKQLQLKQKETLSLKRKDPQFITFELKNSGIYKLNVKSLGSGGTARCGLASQKGRIQWLPCGKTTVLQQGWYFWWVENRGKETLEVEVSVTEEIPSIGKPFSINAQANLSQNYQIKIENAGYYHFEVKAPEAKGWGCKVGKQHGNPNASMQSPRCQLFTWLQEGTHKLTIWRPESEQKKQLKGSLTIRNIGKKPENNLPWKGHVLQGKIEDVSVLSWKLPRLRGVQANITIMGSGTALLIQGQRVLAACYSKTALTNCQWGKTTYRKSSTLLLYSHKAKLSYSIQAVEKNTNTSGVSLRLNTRLHWSATSHPGTVSVILKGQGTAIVEAVGQNTRCYRRTNGASFAVGCKQRVQLETAKPKLFKVSYQKGAGKILMYRPGSRKKALWGKAPQAPLPQFKKEQEGRVIALSGRTNAYLLQVKKTHVVQIQARSNASTCAFGKVNGGILALSEGAKGCRLSIPVSPGNYWFAIRPSTNNTLLGSFIVQSLQSRKIVEGKKGPFLIGPGMQMWFQFTVNTTGTVGVGALGNHDEMNCKLYHKGKLSQLKSCRVYQTLQPGTYWYSVSLPSDQKATALSIILRGTKPPPNTPPTRYLQKLINNAKARP